MSATTDLKRTPLFDAHQASKAKMVDFGGWNMPVQYSRILEEHNAVRNAVGLFDVSHMGEIDVRGPEAVYVRQLCLNQQRSKIEGRAGPVFGALLYEHGGFVDDILVHKVKDDHYFLCVNSSNQEKDFEHIVEHNRFNAQAEFSSDRYAQLAIQGPKALRTLQKLTDTDLRRSNITGLWMAGFRELRRVSPVPAIRERTDSKYMSLLKSSIRSGTSF